MGQLAAGERRRTRSRAGLLMNLQVSFHPIMPRYKEPRLQERLLFNTKRVHRLVMFLDNTCSRRPCTHSWIQVILDLSSSYCSISKIRVYCFHSHNDISFPILLTEKNTEPLKSKSLSCVLSEQRVRSHKPSSSSL